MGSVYTYIDIAKSVFSVHGGGVTKTCGDCFLGQHEKRPILLLQMFEINVKAS